VGVLDIHSRGNGKGIIRITPSALQVAIDYNDPDKRKDIVHVDPSELGVVEQESDKDIDFSKITLSTIKEALLLPEGYAVHQVLKEFYGSHGRCLGILVSSNDIPEVSEGETLPFIDPWYIRDYSEDKVNGVALLKDIKIGTTVIYAKDRQ
jgi:hypothetical protein